MLEFGASLDVGCWSLVLLAGAKQSDCRTAKVAGIYQTMAIGEPDTLTSRGVPVSICRPTLTTCAV